MRIFSVLLKLVLLFFAILQFTSCIEKSTKSQCELRKLENYKLADLYGKLGKDYQFRGNFYAAKKAF